MGSHLSQEGINKIMKKKELEKKREAAKENFDVVKGEWRRLAAFMRKQR